MKRAFDVVLSAVALVLTAPLLIALYFLVAISMGRPVFSRQTRPGAAGKPFEMIKFRTMSDERGRDGQLLSDHHRMTKVGNFLRSSSLDELPELWNVLRGDMSLVGPRPLLMQYLPLYSARQNRRHEVRPGITGWAQVNGRNQLAWADRFECDVWYVENRTFLLDLKIIWLTLAKVFRREGVKEEGHVTMSPFEGNGTDR